MRTFAVLFFLWGCSICRLTAAWIWVEGEAAANTNIGRHPWYYGEVKKNQLSGGDFLAHFDQAKKGEAEYRFNAPVEGEYSFWLRANPVQASLKYSLNGGPETAIDFSRNQSGSVNIAANNAPDLRFVAWSEAGKVVLKAGENRLKFTMDSANSNHGAIDCFVFSNESYSPMGVLKPDQVAQALVEIASANRGWVPWVAPTEEFRDSPIDLRRLNEKFAGEKGRIQARGEQFVHGDTGEPLRFWAVNSTFDFARSPDDLKYAARLLAKVGVNLVRLHGSVFDEKTGELRPGEVRHRVETIQALKAEGIYSHLSIYFPLWLRPDNGPGWREGYDGQKHTFALLYFEPEFQQMYQAWWKEILSARNAEGTALVDDPALMAVEIVNEDSFFFWTFGYQNIPGPQMRKLEKMFGEWGIKKYGSLAQTLAAWNNLRVPQDDEGRGLLGFRTLYDLFNRKTPRDQDTAAFLLEVQRNFYTETVKFLRGLGYKGMITASNWTTANSDILGPLEKYSYLPGDFMDHHGYYGSNLKGDNAAWSIREEQTFSHASALRFDAEEPGKPKAFLHPAMDPMYNRKPSMISEIAWNRPNRFRSEAPLFLSAYGALQDTDAIVHFAFDGAKWNVKPGFFMQPWTLMSPGQIGQFPAAALIYRQGLIKTGDLVADLPLKLADALALKGSKLVQRANLDELRKQDGGGSAEEISETGMDPLISLVGRVNISINDQGGPPQVMDLSSLIRRDVQTVESSTGELKLDYGKGVLVLNAPSAQGVSGNLRAAGLTELTDLSIASDLELGHIVIVPLDGQPLASSSCLLVQVMTEEKATHFTVVPAGEGILRIANIGQDPWLIKEIQGTIRFKRADAAELKVTALDFNGYPAEEVGTGRELKLRPDRIYYLIRK